MGVDQPTLTLNPAPADWAAALVKAISTRDHAHDRTLLGLPTDRPVVVSGHQPTRWHAGILAKLLAAGELARATGAHHAWIIPDMDEVDPTTTRVPLGRGSATTTRFVRILAGDPPGQGVPAGSLSPRDPTPADPDLPGLADALARFRHEPSLAMQVGKAVVSMAVARFGLPKPTVFAASDLLRTRAWAHLINALSADPARAVGAYNAAALDHPDADIRPLTIEKSRVELPLWRVRPGLPRMAVFSDQLATTPPDQLRPRALAMTALVRASLADLFIHGTGGERYDLVTDQWLAHWPAAPAWTLAPTAMATANAFPDLGIDPADLPDPARARWTAHHARHDPAMLGDDAAARTKRDIVSMIRSMKESGESPAPAFAELQKHLRATRDRHAARLADLGAQADRAEALRAVRDMATDRTWPWPVLSDHTLDALHAQARSAFQSAAKIPPCPQSCPDPCSCRS